MLQDKKAYSARTSLRDESKKTRVLGNIYSFGQFDYMDTHISNTDYRAYYPASWRQAVQGEPKTVPVFGTGEEVNVRYFQESGLRKGYNYLVEDVRTELNFSESSMIVNLYFKSAEDRLTFSLAFNEIIHSS